MKHKLLTVLLAAVCGAILFTACPEVKPDPVSVQSRMEMFIADANAGNYSSLKAHTHPDAGMYNTAPAAYWETMLSPYGSLGNLAVSGNTATADDGGAADFSFTLEEDEEAVYKIRSISLDGTPIFF